MTLDLGKILVSIYKFDECVAWHTSSKMEGEQKINNSSSEIWLALPPLAQFPTFHLSYLISHQSTEENTKYSVWHIVGVE